MLENDEREKEELLPQTTEPPTEGDICIICNRAKAVGIRICSQLICEECEAEMVNTDAQDEKYPRFIHQMKQIWYRKNA